MKKKLVLFLVLLMVVIAGQAFAADSKVITAQEVAKHNSHDCWMIIEGKVYNLSKYMDKHPAGMDAIMSSCGKDATEAFNNHHRKRKTKEALKEFYIGELAK